MMYKLDAGIRRFLVAFDLPGIRDAREAL